MPRLINFDILKHPANWLVVWSMLLIFVMLCDVVRDYHNSTTN